MPENGHRSRLDKRNHIDQGNMAHKNEGQTDIDVFNHLSNKNFSHTWEVEKTGNTYIKDILSKSSKNNKGNKGCPGLIYVNEAKQLLILIENKGAVKNHISKDGVSNPQKFAVDGVKHYLKFFLPGNIDGGNSHIKNWNVLGIAFSGDIKDAYNKRTTTFAVKNEKIEDVNINEFLDETDYLELFESVNLEEIASKISESSKEINNRLRGAGLTKQACSFKRFDDLPDRQARQYL